MLRYLSLHLLLLNHIPHFYAHPQVSIVSGVQHGGTSSHLALQGRGSRELGARGESHHTSHAIK